MFRIRPLLALVVTMLAADLVAEDAYYARRIRDLEIVSGELPTNLSLHRYSSKYPYRRETMLPYARVEGDGEAYVVLANESSEPETLSGPRVAVRVGNHQHVEGTLYLPKDDLSGMAAVAFRIPAEPSNQVDEKAFLRAKKDYYDSLLQRDIAGAAWFRHQSQEAGRILGVANRNANNRVRRFFGTSRSNDLQNTYALVSGGRAVSENLQLDRVLPEASDKKPTVPLSTLTGITVKEYDWQPLVQDKQPRLDTLAALIPHDQHALFFPSFQSLIDLVDYAQANGTPILRAAEPRSEDAATRQRYHEQLCLPLGTAERLLGNQLVSSVAVTGGDPYFRTGTDVAVILEPKNLELLRATVTARVAFTAKQNADATPLSGNIGDVEYTGLQTDDRRICCYVATVSNALVVTNSPRQLSNIIHASSNTGRSLASLDEYKFFRDRYPLADGSNAALLVLSDATIRRWCGPQWRIATSRRTRSAAIMSELQARLADRVLAGVKKVEAIDDSLAVTQNDYFQLTPDGVTSTLYGNLAFQTPINEIEIDKVTDEEATLYARWRDGYQRNWSNFFDPIAASLEVNDGRLSADLTVMPLIARSDYDILMQLSKGASLKRDSADPHPGTLLHWAMSINKDSALFRQGEVFVSSFMQRTGARPFSWLGESISLYVEDGKIFEEFEKAGNQDQQITDFMSERANQIPAAIHIEVSNGFKLVAFLTAVRGFVEQSAPGMTVWETKEHNGRSYVKVSPSEIARSGNEQLDKASVYYSTSGKALVIAFSEAVLKRSLDREEKHRQLVKEGKEIDLGPHAWIGENLGLKVEHKFLALLDLTGRRVYHQLMQVRAWGNLPILNEWKRKYPDRDPVEVHELLWQRKLISPEGGGYVWNEQWQTMESTAYGCPGNPRIPATPTPYQKMDFANFGLTFEDDGLRARAEIQQRD